MTMKRLIQELNKEFDSAEHKSLGDVKLPGLPENFTHFVFPKGVKLTFGEIIALAGDYFGVALAPISEGGSILDCRKRFLAAYATLANCDPGKVYRLTRVITTEGRDANNAVKVGQDESVGLNKITVEETKVALESTNGNYLILAEHNLDHFNTQAHLAFQIGYGLAMEAAEDAGKLTDALEQQKQLEYAYSLLGFACHFYTDLFAGGHIRTPRAELETKFGPEIGSLLSLFMHNEDGDMGLEVSAENVTDQQIAIWQAKGDGHLFEKNSRENQQRALMAVQEAVNEIHQAFLNRRALSLAQSKVMRLIPIPTKNNHLPLFKLGEDKKIYCRVPINGEPKMGPETERDYAELTRVKAMEILLHHGENALETSIKDRVAKALQAIEQVEESVEAALSARISAFRQSCQTAEKRVEDNFEKLKGETIFKQRLADAKLPTQETISQSKLERNCTCAVS